MTIYRVMAKRDDEDYQETQRTSRRAAEADVLLLKDIARRHTWIVECETS